MLLSSCLFHRVSGFTVPITSLIPTIECKGVVRITKVSELLDIEMNWRHTISKNIHIGFIKIHLCSTWCKKNDELQTMYMGIHGMYAI